MPLPRLILLLVAALLHGGGCDSGSRQVQLGSREFLDSIGLHELAGTPEFAAVVKRTLIHTNSSDGRITVMITLQRPDGKKLALVEMDATPLDIEFAHKLNVGTQYRFPQLTTRL